MTAAAEMAMVMMVAASSITMTVLASKTMTATVMAAAAAVMADNALVIIQICAETGSIFLLSRAVPHTCVVVGGHPNQAYTPSPMVWG